MFDLFYPPEFMEPWLTRRRNIVEPTKAFVTIVSIRVYIVSTFRCKMELLLAKWLALVWHVKISKVAFTHGRLEPIFGSRNCGRVPISKLRRWIGVFFTWVGCRLVVVCINY